jgi:lipid-A-disaccharide synthase
MKIFVSAAEISSDLQAEKILRELIKLYPAGSVEIAGIGGPKLRALVGFKTLEEAESLRAMGFTEVMGKLFHIKKVLARTVSFLENYRPDLILTFDYPEFHLALLKACEKKPSLHSAIKICGIPPKVWVWRSHRLELIRRLYDAVWVLFPFEEKLYQEHRIPVIYAGNPLIAEVVGGFLPEKPEWLTKDSIRLAVLPGSREAEIRAHLAVIPGALKLLSEKSGRKVIAEVPIPIGVSTRAVKEALRDFGMSGDSISVSYLISEGDSSRVLARNSLGLIKSGTATLEAATLACVPVIFYRVSYLTRLIFQYLVRYSGAVGLPNILLGAKLRKDAVFPELLGPEATPEAMSEALMMLVNDPALLAEKQKSAAILRELLVPTGNIPLKIAEKIKTFVDGSVVRKIHRKAAFQTAFVSFLWSSVNAFRRKLFAIGLFRQTLVSTQSVLVGNLQAGGAGKTPLVIAIAKEAVKRGYTVGVVSRGYGGNFSKAKQWSDLGPKHLLVSLKRDAELAQKPEVIGDEPVEILNSVPSVTLGLGPDRVKLTQALQNAGINFIVFDDGFQNLKFKATHVVLAMTDASPSEVVFRDFFSAANSANLIVQTKGAPLPIPLPNAGNKVVQLEWSVDHLPQNPIWLLCGVADPSEVAQFYRNLGVKIGRVIALPDHAHFDFDQVRSWKNEAEALGHSLCVTEKDWVKLKSDDTLTLFVLRRKISSEGWLDVLFER